VDETFKVCFQSPESRFLLSTFVNRAVVSSRGARSVLRSVIKTLLVLIVSLNSGEGLQGGGMDTKICCINHYVHACSLYPCA